MKNWLFVLVFCLTFFTVAEGATYFFRESCPVGYSPGDTWPLEECGQCLCEESGFQCSDCGVMQLQDFPGCYYDENNNVSKYPDCCFRELKCRGDEDFEEEKYSRVRYHNSKTLGEDEKPDKEQQ